MGPIELTDFVGIDTMLATMTGLYNGFHDSKYRPCPLLETMVKSGMLGTRIRFTINPGNSGASTVVFPIFPANSFTTSYVSSDVTSQRTNSRSFITGAG